MDVSRLERIGAASGIAFVGVIVAAFSVVPSPPDLSDVDGLVSYAAENRTGLLWQVYLATTATILLLWFAGSIRSHLRRNEGETGRLAAISYGGAVAAAVLAGVGALMFASLALRADGVQDPAIVSLLADTGTLAFTLLFAPLAVWVGATALASYRTEAFPKWYAGISGALAIVFAATPALIFGDRGFFSIDEAFGAGTWALFGMLVWVTSTSVMLMIGEAATVTSAVEESHERWHLRRVSGQ